MKALLIIVVPSLLFASGAFGSWSTPLFLRSVDKTLAEWRGYVGHGSLTRDQRQRLKRVARAAVRPTKATVMNENVIAGNEGPAIYLDLVSRNPVWTLRHADSLVRVVANPRYDGGWAIRLRNAHHVTVWIAGYSGGRGFVGSANEAIGAASPVEHQ